MQRRLDGHNGLMQKQLGMNMWYPFDNGRVCKGIHSGMGLANMHKTCSCNVPTDVGEVMERSLYFFDHSDMKNQINAKMTGTTGLVTLIEDNVELRTSYALILKRRWGLQNSGDYDSCRSNPEKYRRTSDIILMEFDFAGDERHFWYHTWLKLLPAVRIVVITVPDEPDCVYALCARAIDLPYQKIPTMNKFFRPLMRCLMGVLNER